MISKANLLRRSASFGELFSFSFMSFMVVVLAATGGYGLLEAVPELLGSTPGLTGSYLSKLVNALLDAVIVVVACGFSVLNYRTLQNTVARCELAEDEMAWINQCPEYERMVEDRELMRLAANVSRVCRTYPATHGLFVRFLSDYRTLLDDYGGGVDAEIQEARIELSTFRRLLA